MSLVAAASRTLAPVSFTAAAKRDRERRLLPIVLTYLPVPAAGALLSIAWGVGATPVSGAADLPIQGTALAPPLFLPLFVAGAAAAARREGWPGTVGLALCSLVGTAFLAGSTLNLPNDLAAGSAAAVPAPLIVTLAGIHIALAIALLWHALPALVMRFRR